MKLQVLNFQASLADGSIALTAVLGETSSRQLKRQDLFCQTHSYSTTLHGLGIVNSGIKFVFRSIGTRYDPRRYKSFR